MSWWNWKRIKKNASELLENRKAVEKVVIEAADVWIEYNRARSDGTITTAEFVRIGKAAVEAGEAAYDLAVMMGWRT